MIIQVVYLSVNKEISSFAYLFHLAQRDNNRKCQKNILGVKPFKQSV